MDLSSHLPIGYYVLSEVAHVLYEFDQSFGMHFWTEQNPRWDAHASLDGLFFFFSTFGREFANTLLLVKRQQLG